MYLLGLFQDLSVLVEPPFVADCCSFIVGINWVIFFPDIANVKSFQCMLCI